MYSDKTHAGGKRQKPSIELANRTFHKKKRKYMYNYLIKKSRGARSVGPETICVLAVLRMSGCLLMDACRALTSVYCAK